MKRVRDGIDVPVALRVLAVGEEALRHDRDADRPWRASSRHRAAGAPPRSPRVRAGAEIGRNAAVDDVQHEDRLPFLALGGMDRREDQIVLVEQRHAGLVAGGVGRIERQLGQEALARRIAGGDLLELEQIGAARLGVLVDALEMRLVPEPRAFELGRPAGTAVRSSPTASTKAVQSSPARGGAGASASAAIGSGCSAMCVEHALRRGRPDAREAAAARGSRRRGRAGSRRSAAAPACP